MQTDRAVWQGSRSVAYLAGAGGCRGTGASSLGSTRSQKFESAVVGFSHCLHCEHCGLVRPRQSRKSVMNLAWNSSNGSSTHFAVLGRRRRYRVPYRIPSVDLSWLCIVHGHSQRLMHTTHGYDPSVNHALESMHPHDIRTRGPGQGLRGGDQPKFGFR